MQWHEAFDVWYIGCFSVVFGIAMILGGGWFSSVRRIFHSELRDSALQRRLSAVVQRRDELEGDHRTAWRMTGCFSMLVGALVLVRAIAPVVGYALLCAALAIIMSQIYLSMRNRSARRAASLAPRTVTTAVPWIWYAGGVVSACLPLAMLSYPASRTAAAIVCLATLAIVFVAFRTASMAALLSGDDPDLEVYVDNRLRWSRVSGQLVLAYAVSYVFVSMSAPSMRPWSPLVPAIDLLSSILLVAFAAWAAVVYFRGRLRAKAPIAQ